MTGASSIGSFITTGTAESTQLMLRVHTVAPSQFVVQHNYTTGLRIYNISLSASNGLPSSNSSYHLIDIQQNITNVELTCPAAGKSPLPYLLKINWLKQSISLFMMSTTIILVKSTNNFILLTSSHCSCYISIITSIPVIVKSKREFGYFD